MYDQTDLCFLLIEHDPEICEVEDGQESEDWVDQDGYDFALLVPEVRARLAARSDGRVEDRRQLFAKSEMFKFIFNHLATDI